MVAYGIIILTLIKQLKSEFYDVIQPWYVDDAGALGTFANVELYFNFIKQLRPGRGCYPETSKRVLIVYPYNIQSRELFGLRHKFKVCTGARYLGSFIGDEKFKCDWLDERTNTWEYKTTKTRKTAGKNPQ